MGYIIPLGNEEKLENIDVEKLLDDLKIDFLRIRLWPRCSWLVAYYPYLWWLWPLGFISYIIGPKRVFTVAATKGKIKAPPMEIMPGFAKEFGATSSNAPITYVLAQDNTDLYHIDPDVLNSKPLQ